MSVFYELCGSVAVKDVPEIEEIVDGFNKISLGLELEILGENNEGGIDLQFSGGTFTSYNGIEDIDAQVHKLDKFVVKPTTIIYECDGERGELYIGLPDEYRDTISSNRLDEIMGMIPELTEKDKGSLREYLS